MASRRLIKDDKESLQNLGKKIEKLILEKKGYRSLDAFALDFHDDIAKPTLYQLCEGKRDMKLSTLFRLSRALEIPVCELLKGI